MECTTCQDTGNVGQCVCTGGYCLGTPACGAVECLDCHTTVTLTLSRGGQDITVELQRGPWKVNTAVDEDGNPVSVSPKEALDLYYRGFRGEDETGE